jgi:hypothetical protein
MRRKFGLRLTSFFAVAVLVVSLLSGPALAETKHALFVAVNDYPKLGEEAGLSGPANDAHLIVDYLTATPELGFASDRITVLANGGGETDGEPTRQAILDHMQALADKVASGDFVYIHFAGHGSRQRARNPATEPDGLDEIFLPADTEEARDGIYPNALVDDDIGTALDAIRSAGAFVFVVFDSCHSSTATRNAGGEPAGVKYRWMPEPEGAEAQPGHAIGQSDLREATLGKDEARPGLGQDAGGMVAFFAAQTIETTPEFPQPRDSEAAKTYGLFSYTLLNVLAKSPGATYRELAQGITHAYAAGNISKPTPLFEGDLDRVVFGQQDRRSVLGWPVAVDGGSVSLKAGALHGLEKGAILALLPEPLAGDEQALGYVRVRTDDPLTAQATPARYANLAPPTLSDLPPSAVARVVESPLSFELRVALPSEAATRFAEAAAYARREIEQAAADEQLPANLRLVEAGESADLTLIVASEAELYPGGGGATDPRLWFLPPGGQLPTDHRFKPHSIGLDGGMTEEQRAQMRENFVAVFRATSLAQLTGLSQLDRRKVAFGLELDRTGTGVGRAIEKSSVPVMAPGDQLVFSVDNQSTRAVDVDMLLIGPDYSIKHMLGLRFQRGDKVKGALGDIADAGLGLWRLVLVMREVDRNSVHSDLSFLNQIGAQTRSTAASGARDFGQLLEDIGGGAATRGATRSSGRNALKGSLEIFSLEAVPAG